jgi:SAM-dependent methyltransferase
MLKAQLARYFTPLRPLLRYWKPHIDTTILFSPAYRILKCNSCGYGIHEKQDISDAILAEYYRVLYRPTSGISEEEYLESNDSLFLDDDRASGQYRMVRDYLPLNNKHFNVLEIGAGNALFLRLLRYHRFNVSIDVIEAGHGWEKYYKKHRIKRIADFFPFETTKKKYDYIHTSHWIEHVVPDIRKVIDELRGLLVPEGLLFVEVPNCTDDYWNLDIGDSPHIHFFTEGSLTRLFANFGFGLLKLDCYGCSNKEFHEFFHPKTKSCEPNERLLKEVKESVRYSIPRENGDCIRGIFVKSDISGLD